MRIDPTEEALGAEPKPTVVAIEQTTPGVTRVELSNGYVDHFDLPAKDVLARPDLPEDTRIAAHAVDEYWRRHHSTPVEPIASKTIKRKRDEGRIVITLETKVSAERMRNADRWKRDAVDILRETLEELDFLPLKLLLRHYGINVTDVKAEASK
jgi:hypothetical protein